MARGLGGICLAAALVAAVVSGFVTPARGASGAATETLYYGKTSQGLGVYIPVKGTQIPRDTRAYLLYWIYKHVRYSTLEFHPGAFPGATVFHGGRLSYHQLAKLPGGTIENWFEARLAQAGKVISGSYRERDVGFSPVPRDTGTVRFTAVAWSSQQGQQWAGSTGDGKPLRMTVRYRLVPGHVIVNGVRVPETKHTVSLAATTRPLVCQNADGTSTRINAPLPVLSAELIGSEDLASSFSARGGLTTLTAATGTATSAGTTVKAELTVKRLAWQGVGPAATGTLSYQGTTESETGTANCARVTSTFTLRPR